MIDSPDQRQHLGPTSGIAGPIPDESLHQFIASLYRLAGDQRPTMFRREALSRLRPILGVDAAVWYLTDSRRGKVCSNVAVGAPDEAAYQVSGRPQEMTGYLEAFAAPGHAIDFSSVVEDEKFFGTRAFQSSMGRYGLHRALRCASVDTRLRCDSMLVVLRRDRERTFTPGDRQQFELLAYHLIEAFVLCLHLSLRTKDHEREPVLLCGPQGLLIWTANDFDPVTAGVPMDGPDIDIRAIMANQLTPGAKKLEVTYLDDLYLLRKPQLDPLTALSPREREIAEQLAQSETNKAIADQLGLNSGTIASFASRIYEKLGVSSKGELIRLLNKRPQGSE